MGKKKSVVQDWLSDLTWKQQTVLLAATRGCDGVAKEDASKHCHKIMRSCILENAGTANTGFMTVTGDPSVDQLLMDGHWNRIKDFRKDIDMYPMHYVLHFTHAAEILGYKHPEVKWRGFWFQVYSLFVDAMHLHIETEEELDFRLRDGVDSD